MPSSGKRLKKQKEVKYLGSLLNEKGDPEPEITKRIQDVAITLSRLYMFFAHSNNSTRVKVQVYNAVIRSKLTYGLESVVMNKSVMSKLSAFHLRGLRKILHIPTTYCDRRFDNNYVYAEAKRAVDEQQAKMIKPISEYLSERRKWLLAKLITLRDTDPVAKITFDPTTLQPPDYGKRRVGQPRLNWYKVTLQDFWQEVKDTFEQSRHQGQLDLNNPVHIQGILELAQQYDSKHHYQSDTLSKTPTQINRREQAKRQRDLRTEEDKRVDEDKWLYKDNYERLVREGTLTGHRGNPDGTIRSHYWIPGT